MTISFDFSVLQMVPLLIPPCGSSFFFFIVFRFSLDESGREGKRRREIMQLFLFFNKFTFVHIAKHNHVMLRL